MAQLGDSSDRIKPHTRHASLRLVTGVIASDAGSIPGRDQRNDSRSGGQPTVIRREHWPRPWDRVAPFRRHSREVRRRPLRERLRRPRCRCRRMVIRRPHRAHSTVVLRPRPTGGHGLRVIRRPLSREGSTMTVGRSGPVMPRTGHRSPMRCWMTLRR